MVKDSFIEELLSENICTYFVLPLLKISRNWFGYKENFVESYLSRDLTFAFVEVKNVASIKKRLLMHPDFQDVWVTGKTFTVGFSIPYKWDNDLDLFIQGKYSAMSDKSKELIQNNSGLVYRQKSKDSKYPLTDLRLMALTRGKSLKELWEKTCGMVFPEDSELLSKPSDRIYFNPDLFVDLKSF